MINKLLKEEKRIYDKMKANHEHGYFDRQSIPEVLALNKEYRTKYPDKYGYNADIVDYIVKKENVSDDLIDILKTQVYLSQQDLENKKKDEKIKKFNDEGFYVIESDEKLDGEKIEFIVDSSGEMFGGINKLIGKLVWSQADMRLMAMKSRCRRKGYWVDSCQNDVYIKLLKKGEK